MIFFMIELSFVIFLLQVGDTGDTLFLLANKLQTIY